MITIHSSNKMKLSDILSVNQHHRILTDMITNRVNKLFNLPSVFTHNQSVIKLELSFPMLIHQYNRYMRGSDSNAQTRAYYNSEIHCFCYWWLLFKLLLDISVLNAYILWKLHYSKFKLSHSVFQNQVTMSLIQNSADSDQKRATKVRIIELQSLKKSEHDWISLFKKKYCQICNIDKERVSQKSLSELTNLSTKQQQWDAQTCWECSECVNSVFYKKSAYWNILHV